MGNTIEKPKGRVSQKALAAHLGLSPSTVSLVLNNAPLAAAIPERTRERIIKAARELDYRPDLYARYLFTGKSDTVAVMVPEIGEGFSASILAGIDEELGRRNYVYFLANHHGDSELIREFPRRFPQRAVEGVIAINTPIAEAMRCPVVSVGSQPAVGEMARIVLDNRLGARLAVRHLAELGHKRIAVIRGHRWRPAAAERWEGVQAEAQEQGLELRNELIVEMVSDEKHYRPATPAEGYDAAKELLSRRAEFTALVAFNDISAMGAIRALHEAGWRVPDDVSVIGFDDLPAAAYAIPRLTTLRQPLHQMGALAASELVRWIGGEKPAERDVVVKPELMLRETTGAAPVSGKR
jgi:LacI family transcriptional regulator